MLAIRLNETIELKNGKYRKYRCYLRDQKSWEAAASDFKGVYGYWPEGAVYDGDPFMMYVGPIKSDN